MAGILFTTEKTLMMKFTPNKHRIFGNCKGSPLKELLWQKSCVGFECGYENKIKPDKPSFFDMYLLNKTWANNVHEDKTMSWKEYVDAVTSYKLQQYRLAQLVHYLLHKDKKYEHVSTAFSESGVKDDQEMSPRDIYKIMKILKLGVNPKQLAKYLALQSNIKGDPQYKWADLAKYLYIGGCA